MNDYFYGAQSDQFSFYRAPTLLFTDARYRNISTDAKVLYGTMVTEVYSHILDDDRQHNAELFEETFYSGKTEDKKGAAPGGVGQSSDMEAIMRILKNPEAAKLLKTLLSALDN